MTRNTLKAYYELNAIVSSNFLISGVTPKFSKEKVVIADPGDHLPLRGGVTEPMGGPDNLLSGLRTFKKSWRNAGCCCFVYHQDCPDISPAGRQNKDFARAASCRFATLTTINKGQSLSLHERISLGQVCIPLLQQNRPDQRDGRCPPCRAGGLFQP